jgi:hypothetical protein
MSEKLVEYNVDSLVNAVGNMLGNEKQINALNVATVCLNLMQIVERVPKLKGAEKKKLVLDTIEKFLTSSGGDLGLMAVVPSFMDSMVSIDKGTVTISLTPENVETCCMGIISTSKKP